MFALPLRLAVATSLLIIVALFDPTAVSANPKAEAAFKPLLERFNANSGDRVALAKDLLAFRRAHAGTLPSVQAAALLSKLPSVLDQLDPAKIKPIEKFDWQPKELVAVLGEHLGRHGGGVTCVAYSPDGKQAASGGSSFVRLWDPVTMRLRRVLSVSNPTCIAFSRDNSLLAASTIHGTVIVWDMTPKEGPAPCFTISAATTSVPSIAFGPGNRLAIPCSDNQFRVFDVSGKEAKDLSTIHAHDKALGSVAWSPDGKILATGSYDTTIKLWTLGEGGLKEFAQIAGHPKEVTVLAFNPLGNVLASGSPDGSIRLWTMPAGPRAKERMIIQSANTGGVTSLSFSSSGNTLAAGYTDGNVRLWTVGGAKPVERSKLEGHPLSVNGVAYSPDNKMLLTGSSDWTARSWDLTGAKPTQRHEPWSHLSHVYSVGFSTDSLSLATGSWDGILRLWDMARPEPRTRSFLKVDGTAIYSVAFSPDGKYVAAGGNSTAVRQWEAATGRSLRTYTNHTGPVYKVAFGPDGKRLFTMTQNNLCVFDADKGGEKMRIAGHDTPIHQGAFSPDGRFGLTCSGQHLYKDGKPVYDKQNRPVYTECLIKYWELDSGRELFCDKSHMVPVYCVAFSAEGKEAFSGALYESRIRRWHAADGKLTDAPDVKAGSGYLQAITVSPDDQTAVTIGLDGKLVLWELASGKRLKEWVFHENIGNVAYAPDCRHLVVPLGTGVVYILQIDKK